MANPSQIAAPLSFPPPQSLLERLRERASRTPATIVLAEGGDPRVVAAAELAAASGLCRPLLVGAAAEVEAAAQAAGVTRTVPVVEPDADPHLPELAARLAERLGPLTLYFELRVEAAEASLAQATKVFKVSKADAVNAAVLFLEEHLREVRNEKK